MQTNTESNRTATIVERKTISIMKACELVGVSRRTIYNWIAGGKIEYVRTAGGSVRIFVDTLWREPRRRRPGAQRSFMSQDFGLLFHRLNNQLGIILANAELLEAKLGEDAARARASLVVTSALEAMTTAREISTPPEETSRGQIPDSHASHSSQASGHSAARGPRELHPSCTPFHVP